MRAEEVDDDGEEGHRAPCPDQDQKIKSLATMQSITLCNAVFSSSVSFITRDGDGARRIKPLSLSLSLSDGEQRHRAPCRAEEVEVGHGMVEATYFQPWYGPCDLLSTIVWSRRPTVDHGMVEATYCQPLQGGI